MGHELRAGAGLNRGHIKFEGSTSESKGDTCECAHTLQAQLRISQRELAFRDEGGKYLQRGRLPHYGARVKTEGACIGSASEVRGRPSKGHMSYLQILSCASSTTVKDVCGAANASRTRGHLG